MVIRRGLTVVLSNGLASETIRIERGETIVKAAVRLGQWLSRCITRVDENGICKSFSVSVHASGQECDHEIPAGGAP